jgi:hypothetical protein
MAETSEYPSSGCPRYLSLVHFNYDSLPTSFHAKYPFINGRTYIFFGEIPNMLGHCVVADHKTGQLYSGYHTESFVELTEDDT